MEVYVIMKEEETFWGDHNLTEVVGIFLNREKANKEVIKLASRRPSYSDPSIHYYVDTWDVTE